MSLITSQKLLPFCQTTPCLLWMEANSLLSLLKICYLLSTKLTKLFKPKDLS